MIMMIRESKFNQSITFIQNHNILLHLDCIEFCRDKLTIFIVQTKSNLQMEIRKESKKEIN